MYVLVQHTVRDFDAWKPAFDEHEGKRAEYGCTCHTIYRDADKPNNVTIVMEYESQWSLLRAQHGSSLGGK
jgi:quinol monooxygenase YgiN